MIPLDKRSGAIRGMFAAIAPRYDLLNHLLSLNLDRYWRRVASRTVQTLAGAQAPVLDLCTGTGDLALELAGWTRVVACDFCHPMLVLARDKLSDRKMNGRISLVEGDTLKLPLAPDRFQAVTIAFGLRNLEDCEQGLREMMRVLRSGGHLCVLEFSVPTMPIFRQLYRLYFRYVLPRLGDWIAGSGGPYGYLCESVRQFGGPAGLSALLRECGFEKIQYRSITGGVVTLHLGVKP